MNPSIKKTLKEFREKFKTNIWRQMKSFTVPDTTDGWVTINKEIESWLEKALQDTYLQSRKDVIEQIKEEINKNMKSMPTPSMEQWNEGLTKGTTYITGIDLLPIFEKVSLQDSEGKK